MKYFIFLLLILSLNLNAQNTDYKIINANVFITYIDTTNTCNTLVLNSTDWKFIKYLDKDFWTIKLKLTNKNKVFIKTDLRKKHSNEDDILMYLLCDIYPENNQICFKILNKKLIPERFLNKINLK